MVDIPPLARQIESCLLDFAKKMNLTGTPHGNDAFEPNFEAQRLSRAHEMRVLFKAKMAPSSQS